MDPGCRFEFSGHAVAHAKLRGGRQRFLPTDSMTRLVAEYLSDIAYQMDGIKRQRIRFA